MGAELKTDSGADLETVLPVAEQDEAGVLKPNLVIKSFNPGYSAQDIGEFFELIRLSDHNISLAGLSVKYFTAKGAETTLFSFDETSEMVGESLLFRLKSSVEGEDYTGVADGVYTRNMSMEAGRLELYYNDEEIDGLCWGMDGESGCIERFYASGKTKTLFTTAVREVNTEEIGEFEHVENYTPKFDPEKPGLRMIEIPEEMVEPKCRTVEFSELLSYFESSREEQFIELFNRGEEGVDLTGCSLRYKNKIYALSGEIRANGFRAIYPATEWGLTLTKNPTSSNKIELLDADGVVVDTLVYSSGQRKGVALAMMGAKSDGSENWTQTFNPTPGSENVYQQFKTCPAGKVINLETGNCVNEATLTKTLAACPEGKYRNPATGRCKSYATTASASLKPCAEGYERNPATGRCRKIVSNDGAEYPIETETFEEKSEFVAMGAIGGVVGVGVLYIIYQYREEILGVFRGKGRKKRARK